MKVQSIDDLDPRIAQTLGYLGNTPALTSLANNRFCYFLYVPRNYFNLNRLSLLVLIHSSSRNASELRKEFAAFAEEQSCIILAPLFPIEPDDPRDSAGYKMLKYGDIRYDQIVLSMVREVHARYSRVDVERFFLFGFSGGGHFVHRFAYLHPHRLKALACGAPGSQTFPDDNQPFPKGVKDLQEIFGLPMQRQQLCSVPTMFIVGDADTDTFYATARGRVIDNSIEGGRYRATARLEEAWRAAGINCHLHVVPSASHEEEKMLDDVMLFFRKLLEN